MKCGESEKGQPINIYLSSTMCKPFLIQREKSGVGGRVSRHDSYPLTGCLEKTNTPSKV